VHILFSFRESILNSSTIQSLSTIYRTFEKTSMFSSNSVCWWEHFPRELGCHIKTLAAVQRLKISYEKGLEGE
jgi:hypothetical protein